MSEKQRAKYIPYTIPNVNIKCLETARSFIREGFSTAPRCILMVDHITRKSVTLYFSFGKFKFDELGISRKHKTKGFFAEARSSHEQAKAIAMVMRL